MQGKLLIYIHIYVCACVCAHVRARFIMISYILIHLTNFKLKGINYFPSKSKVHKYEKLFNSIPTPDIFSIHLRQIRQSFHVI